MKKKTAPPKSPKKFSKSFVPELEGIARDLVRINDDYNNKMMGKKPSGKRLSRQLDLRTKLTPSQLSRVKGQAGEGRSSRYNPDGSQSLELTRRLNKAKTKARKFVLYSDVVGRRLYLSANNKELWPLTFDIKEALKFFEGFDDPGTKVLYWDEFFYQLGIRFKVNHL